MADIIMITAPVLGVNDSTVAVYEYLAENYGSVREGQEILSLETSKTVTVLTAPADGIIHYIVSVGEEVPTGTLLAVIAPTRELAETFYDGGNISEKSDFSSAIKREETPYRETAAHGTDRIFNSENESDNSTDFGINPYPATLGETLRRAGETVKKGDPLCRIRSTRGTELLTAPESGAVRWEKCPYDTVNPGERIGTIGVAYGAQERGPVEKDAALSGTERKYDTIRLSARAKEQLERHNTTAEALGLSGLVREADVLNALSPGRKTDVPGHSGKARQSNSAPAGSFIQPVKGQLEAQSMAKRAEASYLSAANSGAVVSRVSVLVPTRGIITACSENEQLAGRFSAIIIMEVSRLLRKYRRLCSIYTDKGVYLYDEINVGYAISAGFGLTVPVLRNCDRLALDKIISRKTELIGKYLDRRLTEEDISGGTFTVTDLSSSGCYMFEPVLNLGQSAILGVGGENTSRTNYPLILAFDHRVSDGAEAAAFLSELKNRLVAHENALLGVPVFPDAKGTAKDACCEICYRSAAELEKKGRYMFKAVDKNGNERYVCSVCAEGW